MKKEIDYWHRAYISFLILGIFQIFIAAIAALVFLGGGSTSSLKVSLVFLLAIFDIVLAVLLKRRQRHSIFIGGTMLLGVLVFNAIFRGFGPENILIYVLFGYLLWILYKAHNQKDIVLGS
ncbi:MAG: hypothetical protein UY07_C0007G0041 [Parcubacteria group bacterium GW2011_GWA1_47_8]|nr:MAG: hypothetical protein UY07_C0007G0041 [Parcubacteria group bacterium GW2011_GWA1_47_8]KKW07645.1 MAG: hypothetical protein UY42_C0009G0018 [Parcubacteria group bacterium GW2011_GWA2_49_16]